MNPLSFHGWNLSRVCAEEDEEAPLEQRMNMNQTRTLPAVPKTEPKSELDIDE